MKIIFYKSDKELNAEELKILRVAMFDSLTMNQYHKLYDLRQKYGITDILVEIEFEEEIAVAKEVFSASGYHSLE